MEYDIENDARQSYAQKSELEQTLLAGLNNLEWKHDEKMRHLGVLREKVLALLTKKQVAEPAVYPEITRALKDERARKIIMNGSIPHQYTQKYITLARRLRKSYTIIFDPGFEGDTGLVVVSDQPVKTGQIEVEDRKLRLANLGISESLANAASRKVCRRCYWRIIKADPDEAKNYRKLSWADRLLGERCPCSSRQPSGGPHR